MSLSPLLRTQHARQKVQSTLPWKERETAQGCPKRNPKKQTLMPDGDSKKCILYVLVVKLWKRQPWPILRGVPNVGLCGLVGCEVQWAQTAA